MRFGIITIGTQGDVEPFIALGKRLQSKGHNVRIATFRKFEHYVLSEGFEYSPLAGDAVEVMRLLIGEHVSPPQYFRNLDKLLTPIKKEFLSDIQNACEGIDVLLYTVLGSVAWHVIDKINIPCIRVFFCPMDQTGDFPAMTAPILPFGKAYNRFTYTCGDLLWTNATRKLLNPWRMELGLDLIRTWKFPYRSMHGRPIPTLYAYSALVAPKPVEWDENKYLTGYWIRDLKKDWQPDEALSHFLTNGPKPIYIGFGSAVGGSFQQAFEIVMESLRITKVRAVLSSGWGNLQGYNLPDSVFQIGSVPHEWLFQHVAAVIHHGGAGTTAAGLRAGVPSVIVPFGGDQPYWGNCVYKLGVGPKPILRKQLNVRRLVDAIHTVMFNTKMIETAEKLGQQLQVEDGVENAVTIIERITYSRAGSSSQ